MLALSTLGCTCWKAIGEIFYPDAASLPKIALPISAAARFIAANEARPLYSLRRRVGLINEWLPLVLLRATDWGNVQTTVGFESDIADKRWFDRA